MEYLLAFLAGRSDNLRFLFLTMGFETEQIFKRATGLCRGTDKEGRIQIAIE
jgi:hypothetical protein